MYTRHEGFCTLRLGFQVIPASPCLEGNWSISEPEAEKVSLSPRVTARQSRNVILLFGLCLGTNGSRRRWRAITVQLHFQVMLPRREYQFTAEAGEE